MSGCTTCVSTAPPTIADYYSSNIYTWCTNCGNYGIHAAVKRALVAEGVRPCQAVLCFDIGCNGNGSDKIEGYRFHGLHGRVISFAAGAALANRKLKVLAFAGDGATFGEGVGHFVHAVRANFNMTFVFHNNLNYGLTTGQASPTTKRGMKMNSSPDGITSEPIHPARMALALEATFVARTFSGDTGHMTAVLQAALKHPGFSFVEILQSCHTYNKATPHEWYQERVYDVSTQLSDYDTSDRFRAMSVAEDLENHIATGVLFQHPESVPFMERQANRQDKQTELVDEVNAQEIGKLLQGLR